MIWTWTIYSFTGMLQYKKTLIFCVYFYFQSFYIRCTKDGEPTFTCQCNGNCDIVKQGRIRCQYCRYQRCLMAGMCRKGKLEVCFWKVACIFGDLLLISTAASLQRQQCAFVPAKTQISLCLESQQLLKCPRCTDILALHLDSKRGQKEAQAIHWI